MCDGERRPIVMEAAEQEELSDSSCAYETAESGGLLEVPRLEKGKLIVAIYPLNAENYQINPSLNRNVYLESNADDGSVTVTFADGSVHSGTCTGYSPYSSRYYEWNFGEAQAGEYTLQVPYPMHSCPSEAPKWKEYSAGNIRFSFPLP